MRKPSTSFQNESFNPRTTELKYIELDSVKSADLKCSVYARFLPLCVRRDVHERPAHRCFIRQRRCGELLLVPTSCIHSNRSQHTSPFFFKKKNPDNHKTSFGFELRHRRLALKSVAALLLLSWWRLQPAVCLKTSSMKTSKLKR